jgi:hypothetical protein
MTRRTLPRPVAALVAAALVPAVAVAQGIVTGQVVDATTRRGVEGAQVAVEGTQAAVATGADGRFALRSLRPGIVSVRVRAIGYAPFTASNVLVSSGKPTELTVSLVPRPAALQTVAVNARAGRAFRSVVEGSEKLETLEREDIRRAPGVQEDVLRAVALLPGVGVTIGGRNDLVVRGGAPFENLFLVDGIEVPNINHFGSQGSTGGPISLLNIEYVREASFSSGGFGARYGDRTASVTEISLREGNRERFANTVNVSATGIGYAAEGPTGGDGSWFVSLRRSYLDLFFRAAGFAFIPTFYDVNAKVTQQLGRDTKLSFVAIGALNDLALNGETADDRFENRGVLGLDQRQLVTGLTLVRSLPRGALTASLGRVQVDFESFQDDTLVPPNRLFRNRSTEGEWTARAELGWQATAGTSFTLGTQLRFADDLRYDLLVPGRFRTDAAGVPRPLVGDTSFKAARTSAYGDVSTQWRPWLRTTFGLRMDHYGYLAGGRARVAPRAKVAVALDDRTTLVAAGGRYYQGPSFIWLAGDPGNADRLRPIRADQASLQWQRLLRPDLKLQLEGYWKRYADYTTRLYRPQAVLAPAGFEDVTSDIPFGLEPLSSDGRGTSHGVEALLQKRFSEVPLYGLVSLSWNRTRFTALDGVARPGAFETAFIGTAVAGWRFGPKWEVSGKLRAATGRPFTPFVTTGPAAGTLDFTRFNEGGRLPAFAALDVRVDRRWSFARWQLVTYLDVQNISGRTNTSAFEWDPRQQRPVANTALGLLPSIGVNVEF